MATNGFSTETLISEGSIRRVYRAQFDDGKVAFGLLNDKEMLRHLSIDILTCLAWMLYCSCLNHNAGSGYSAPEVAMSGQYTINSDIYSYGVVMLELLTGRKPFDRSRPRTEQSLVRWATPQLHDIYPKTKNFSVYLVIK